MMQSSIVVFDCKISFSFSFTFLAFDITETTFLLA